MKKVLEDRTVDIKTLNGYFNYGNRLQVFALSKIVERLGCTVYVYWPKTKIRVIKEIIKSVFPFSIGRKKEIKLRSFTRKYVPARTDRSQPISLYGSDQIWNPKYLEKTPFLLTNNDKNIKISYAASLGISEITQEQKVRFREALNEYSSISVREVTAKEQLQPLVNKPIEVVLDPTLLLDRKEYEVLEKRPENIKSCKKYILCYILGNRDNEAAIKKLAESRDYDIVFFSDKRDSDYGVEEFLYLIHHAELICTDSFHACVFSFIFERPFVVFRRTGEANYMYTRLQNLISAFNLKDREYNGKEITGDNLIIDYTEAKTILKKEQTKSLNYLRVALGIQDE